MAVRVWHRRAAVVFMVVTAGCVPRVRLPDLSQQAAELAVPDSTRNLATALAPLLHVQHDEPFPLLRVAAVVHPSRDVVAYHLLWEHDVNGQWMPWTQPSDEEEVWVGYDSVTRAPTDLWTYWHGVVLHTPWRDRGRPEIDVQWGKHGSLPHRVVESDLPRGKTLNAFYFAEFVLLPDIALGKLAHGGPWGFFHGYRRYRDYDRPVDTAERLDAVIETANPQEGLKLVFGRKFSNKVHWPWDVQ